MKDDMPYPRTGRRTCRWTVLLGLMAAGISGLLLAACSASPVPSPAPTFTQIPTAAPIVNESNGQRVVFERATFNVELAVTPEQHARGLIGRQHLDDREGMLFIFKAKGLHSFWMNGMVIPLDLVWIDADGTVAGVDANLPPALESTTPPSYSPPRPVLYVLEINAGVAEEAGIRAGSVAGFLPKLTR